VEHLLAGYGHAGTVYEEASTGALGINGDARVPKESAVVHLRSIVSTRNPNLHRGGVRPARLTPRLLHCIILRSMVSHIMQHEIEPELAAERFQWAIGRWCSLVDGA
jgi:hypothetical protein